MRLGRPYMYISRYRPSVGFCMVIKRSTDLKRDQNHIGQNGFLDNPNDDRGSP